MSSDTGINGFIPSLRNLSNKHDSTTKNFVYACIHTNSKNKNKCYTVLKLINCGFVYLILNSTDECSVVL
jgi:hypothetical protein